MNVDEILSLLAEKNITLWVEDNKLKYKAPKEIFTDELKLIVQEQKEQLIAELRNKENIFLEQPLSLNQQSLWFVNYLHPSSSAYNVAVSFFLKTPVSDQIIQRAFDGILEKYSMLRTGFQLSQGSIEPVQKVHPFIQLPIITIDSRNWSREKLESTIYDDYKKPFDLSKAPLVRFHVYQQANDSRACLIVLHHIICDAFSLNMMLKDFFLFCYKYKNQLPISDTEKTEKVIYHEFLKEQQAFIQGQRKSDAALLFWKKQLEMSPDKLQLPYDKTYPQNIAFNGSSKGFVIKGQAFDRIKQFSREKRFSVNSILLTVFEFVLFCLSGQSEFLLGVLSSGRVNRKLTEIFGYLINPLVKRISLDTSISFLDYLKQSHKKTLEIYNYQDLPFPYLVEKFSHKRDHSISPLFQVLYNYINYQSFEILTGLLSPRDEKSVHKIEEFEVEAILINQQEGQFELTFEVFESADQLYCKLKYHTDLFQQETAVNILDLYNKVLEKIISNPNMKLAALYKDFRWSSKLHGESGSRKILLASNFTIEHIKDNFYFWLDYLKLDYRVTIAPYDQVFQMLLDPASELHKHDIHWGIFFIALEKWSSDIIESFIDFDQAHFLEIVNQFISAVKKSQLLSSKNIFIFFTDYQSRIKESENYINFFYSIETKIQTELWKISGVKIYNSKELYRLYPVPHYYQNSTAEMADIPYHEDYSMAMSTFAIRKFFLSQLRPFKVIITDCDNTLWGGVSAEVGWEKLQISDQFIEYQQFLLDKKESGILLCLASKNNHQDVEDVFLNHSEMKLKWDDFVLKKINWNSKADNIRAMASELNLGLDSFVFIDDNIMECAEVKAKCPGVLVIEFSENDVDAILNHTWPLDNIKTSSEVTHRSQFYQSEIERKKLLRNSYDYRQFINDLDLTVAIEPLTRENISRASELSYRVNQFNFTGKKLDEADIIELLKSSNVYILSIHAKDRFSDYGMIGLVVVSLESTNAEMTHFLLSCRALGKGIEYKIMAYLGKLLMEESIEQCEISYIPSARNKPVEMFLNKNFHTLLTSQNSELWKYKIKSDILSNMKFDPDNDFKESPGKTKVVEEVYSDKFDLINQIQQEFNNISKIQRHFKQWKKTRNIRSSDQIRKINNNKVVETELQAKIKKVWVQILNHDNFSINDNFFDIGGKSVLIPSLILELKKQCNIDLLLIDIFKYPTINALSVYLSSNPKENNTPKQIPRANINKIQSLKNKIKNARQRNRTE